MKSFTSILTAGLLSVISVFILDAAEPVGKSKVIEKTPGLVAFWTFGEEAGSRVVPVAPRKSIR